jgi:hypothetical protein
MAAVLDLVGLYSDINQEILSEDPTAVPEFR